MKRSLFGFFTLALVACMAFCWRCLVDPVGVVYRVYREVKDFAVKAVNTAFQMDKQAQDVRSPAIVALVQAKAFVIRLAKRERPVITSTWRMCPST